MFDFKRKAKRKSLSQVGRTLGTLWSQQCDVTKIYKNVAHLHLTADRPWAFQRTGTNLSVWVRDFFLQKGSTVQFSGHWIAAPEILSTTEHLFLCFISGQENTSDSKTCMLYPNCFRREIKPGYLQKNIELQGSNRNNSSCRKISDNSGESCSWAQQGIWQRWWVLGSHHGAGRLTGTCVHQAR